MKKKTILFAAFSILVFACLSSCKKDTKARSLEEIKKSGFIKIAVFSDGKPFGYIDDSGSYQGYDIYFANRLAKDLGLKIKYISVQPPDRIEALQSSKVDIVIANFTVTEERAEKVDFSLPYMKVALGIVSSESALITAPEQLVGKKLIVTKGTTAEKFFTENYPNIELLKFDNYSECFAALLDRRGDAMSTDNTDLLAWALENPGYAVGVESLGNIEEIAPAVQKGNTDLLNWVNQEIRTLSKEKFFHAAYEATLRSVFGSNTDPENLVIEGGEL